MADDLRFVEFEEVPDVSYDPRQHITCLPLKDEPVTTEGNFSLLPETVDISREPDASVPDLIIAVFVVQFDTRRGRSLACLRSVFGQMMLCFE